MSPTRTSRQFEQCKNNKLNAVDPTRKMELGRNERASDHTLVCFARNYARDLL
jgi:hypothetical protein